VYATSLPSHQNQDTPASDDGPVSFPTRRSSVGDSYVVRLAGGGNKENTVSISIVDVGRNSDDIVGNSASEISRQ